MNKDKEKAANTKEKQKKNKKREKEKGGNGYTVIRSTIQKGPLTPNQSSSTPKLGEN